MKNDYIQEIIKIMEKDLDMMAKRQASETEQLKKKHLIELRKLYKGNSRWRFRWVIVAWVTGLGLIAFGILGLIWVAWKY